MNTVMICRTNLTTHTGNRMLLTKQDLVALTGYHYAKRQCHWLAHNGFRFATAADGSPRVLKTHAEIVLGCDTPVAKSSVIDLDALQELL